MLPQLDRLLRDLFIAGVPSITTAAQVGFQPPDDTWRGDVVTMNRNAINAYLVDVRENRRLRSNEREQRVTADGVWLEQAPARMDCHYLITAWSPATVTPAVEPALDEHALLYAVAAVLLRAVPLVPSRVYAAGSLPLTLWPEEFRDVELPTVVLPVEGFGRLSDFWTTMGQNARWKPAVHLVATLPITLVDALAGFLVTTRITDYRRRGVPASAEVLIEIGGSVLDTLAPLPDGSPSPVVGAWVQLQTVAGDALQYTTSDADGHFLFERLHADQYRIRAGAAGIGERSRIVSVPSETGEYDIALP